MLALCLASPRWVVGRQRRTVRGIQKEAWMMKLLEVGSVGVDLSYQCHTTKKGWVLKNVGDQPDSFRVGTRHVHWPSCKKWGCFAGDLDCHCLIEADWHSLMLRQFLIDIYIINMFLLSEWCCAVMPFASVAPLGHHFCFFEEVAFGFQFVYINLVLWKRNLCNFCIVVCH